MNEIDACPVCHSTLAGTHEVHDDRGVRLRTACGQCAWAREVALEAGR